MVNDILTTKVVIFNNKEKSRIRYWIEITIFRF